MKKNILFSFSLLLLIILSCNTTDPKLEPELLLKLEDVSCTEAWLQLTTNNIQLPATINLLKNNVQSKVFLLNTQDSLLYIDSLLPNQTYKLQASSIQSAEGGPVSSNELSVTTMDTTSHNFTWQTFEFGQHSSSVLYDVAIIDENNIWAVGEIYMNDSLGNPDPNAYNAVHWYGQSWELKRINMQSSCNPVTYPPLKAIWAFSENNIVFTSGGSIGWFDGTKIRTDCTIRPLLTGSINKLWGSSNDLYVVGNNGNIAHYNGSQWIKLESGTDLDIYDIWGDYNEKVNEFKIYAVASKLLVNQEKRIIRIDKTGIVPLSTNGIPSNLTGIWFKNKVFYVVGSGMFRKNDIELSSEWKAFHYGLTNYHISDIRGNDYNDIIAAGSFGELVHFNGINWKSYTDETYMNGSWGGTIKGNIICCVGLEDNKAIITIGKR